MYPFTSGQLRPGQASADLVRNSENLIREDKIRIPDCTGITAYDIDKSDTLAIGTESNPPERIAALHHHHLARWWWCSAAMRSGGLLSVPMARVSDLSISYAVMPVQSGIRILSSRIRFSLFRTKSADACPGRSWPEVKGYIACGRMRSCQEK